MESRFAHLRQRDNSVSMMRVKMSRRRSQCQKENRDRTVNNRRQLEHLEQLSELECTRLDVSVVANHVNAKQVKQDSAAQERLKQLARYKEGKDLQKEKEKREKEKKGVFKVGLYRSQGLAFCPLPQVSTATTKAKVTVTGAQTNSRVTRSMKPVQKVPAPPKVRRVEPGVAVAMSTRSSRVVVKPPLASVTSKPQIAIVQPMVHATRSKAAVPVAKQKPAADRKAPKARSRVEQRPAAAPVGQARSTKGKEEANEQAAVQKPSDVMEPVHETMPACLPPSAEEQRMVEDPAPASSFAPQGFVFQAPEFLSSFKPSPLTPRSANSFLSPSVVLPPVPLFPTDLESLAEPSGPSPPKSLLHSPPRPSPTLAPPASPPQETHDVAYFRSAMVSETKNLEELSNQWVPRVEDTSIPEEMRDCMRTVVGQARLLIKERFGQFSGLVDDCDLGRGEKITTCTDLQGFWEMVYFQVEDVHKKFGALKEAESRGWQEECKSPPQLKKVARKPPSAATAKPSGGGVEAKAAAKSRLAAIKAAVKAKREAAKAAQAAGSAVEESTPAPQDPPVSAPDTVVFHGGFFQVESPAKLPGSARRLARATMHQPSPCSVPKFTPAGRTRRSNVSAHASPLPRLTPACVSNTTPLRGPHLGPLSQPCTPVPHQNSCGPTRVSLCFTPVKEAQHAQSGDCHSSQSESVSRQDEVTPYQPGVECMPEDVVARDESELVTEPADFPQEQPESCESVCISQSMLTTEEPNQSEGIVMPEVCSHVPAPPAGASEACEPNLPLLASPCLMASSPPPPPAVHISSPEGLQQDYLHVSGTDGVHADADVPMRVTPDTSVTEDVPGLDFERYLQPAARYSLSPQAAAATESLSPMETDVQMDSPVAKPGESTLEEVMTPTAFPVTVLHSEAPMFTQWTPKPVESEMLLFTPENDRIRQSVCPSDLMMFTPPSHR